MADKQYTNATLADDYFAVETPFSPSKVWYVAQRTKIAALGEVDLAAFYHEHGNFNKLNIKGIGEKTRKTLELILREGVDRAREIVSKGKKAKLGRDPYAGIPNNPPRMGDVDPSWENAADIYEEGRYGWD
tara:strand:+ start:2668 stop:3060 length:393 start_codon:yes stop_codon:yes gene_type:complete